MAGCRGLKLGRRTGQIFRWGCDQVGAVSAVLQLLKERIKTMCRLGKHTQVGPESEVGPPDVPNGHLAVYVGGGDESTSRIIIPVVYFNHPLFSELLMQAENVYGFDYPGGIQIPCSKSEFEDVKMRIAATTVIDGLDRV